MLLCEGVNKNVFKIYWLCILLAKYTLKIMFFQLSYSIGIENMSNGTFIFLTNVGGNLTSVLYTEKPHLFYYEKPVCIAFTSLNQNKIAN